MASHDRNSTNQRTPKQIQCHAKEHSRTNPWLSLIYQSHFWILLPDILCFLIIVSLVCEQNNDHISTYKTSNQYEMVWWDFTFVSNLNILIFYQPSLLSSVAQSLSAMGKEISTQKKQYSETLVWNVYGGVFLKYVGPPHLVMQLNSLHWRSHVLPKDSTCFFEIFLATNNVI